MTANQFLEAVFTPSIILDLDSIPKCKGCGGIEFDDDPLIDGFHWNCYVHEPVIVSVPRNVVELTWRMNWMRLHLDGDK